MDQYYFCLVGSSIVGLSQLVTFIRFRSTCLGSYLGVVHQDGATSCSLGVRVQFEHYPQVLQRILLQHSAVDLLAGMTK